MFNKDNIDLKLILAFTNAYEKLYEKGEITDLELDRILSLIDSYKDYTEKEFKEKLAEIFR